jgi:hypothetical protein
MITREQRERDLSNLDERSLADAYTQATGYDAPSGVTAAFMIATILDAEFRRREK